MMTISNSTGDGVTSVKLSTAIALPDSGTSVAVAGTVLDPAVGTQQTITGSPVTIPAAPGSGNIYYVIQVATATGAATVKQSTSAIPVADAGNAMVFQQTLVPTSTDPALTPAVTPDTY